MEEGEKHEIDYISLSRFHGLNNKENKKIVHAVFNLDNLIAALKSLKTCKGRYIVILLSNDMPVMFKSVESDAGLCVAPIALSQDMEEKIRV